MPDDGTAKGESVAEHYSADAEVYEKTWAPVLRPHGRLLLDRLPLARARRVLDAGAGVGTLLAEIQDRAPDAAVVALDCSYGMLARAPRCYPRCVMDVSSLGFARGSFDVVVLAFMLFHVEDPGRALREVLGIIRPGGAAGTITWDGEPNFAAERVLDEELDALGARRIEGLSARHHPLDSQEKMHDLLARAGFVDTRAWSAPFAHPYGLEEFISVRTSRGPTRRRYESLAPQVRARLLESLRDRLERLPSSDFVDRAQLIFAIGVRPEPGR